MPEYDNVRLWAGQGPVRNGAPLRAQESWPRVSGYIYRAPPRAAYPVELPLAYPKPVPSLAPPEIKRVHTPSPIVHHPKDVPQEEYGPIGKLVDMLAVWLDGKASLSLADDTVRKQFGMLRAFCRRYRIVPKPYLIPSQSLGDVEPSLVTRGKFAVMYKGKYTRPDGASVDVAIKVPHGHWFLTSPDADEELLLGKAVFQEIVLWRRLSQHPRITRMIGVEQRSDGTMGIISEWMENESLSEYLAKRAGDAALNRLQLILDICDGLQHLHSQEVAHGDIKGANILIDENGRAKLCDFGMTTLMHDLDSINPSTQSSPGGTMGYMAPELIDPERYMLPYRHVSLPADIYALGMVMWQVFSAEGQAPWGERYTTQITGPVLEGQRPDRPRHPLVDQWGLTNDMWKLIIRCWNQNWEQRPKISEVSNRVRVALIVFNRSRGQS